jgi:hypothetical protein
MNVNMLLHRIKFSIHMFKHVLFEAKMQRFTPKFEYKTIQSVQLNQQTIKK